MSSTGQSTQTACMLGEYQPNAGQSACIDADVGFYVGIRAAVGQTACPAGTYQASTGASVCTDASPGYYATGTTVVSG